MAGLNFFSCKHGIFNFMLFSHWEKRAGYLLTNLIQFADKNKKLDDLENV